MYANINESTFEIKERLEAFMSAHVYTNEKTHKTELANAKNRFASMQLMEDLKSKARDEGLWNLFVPKSYGGLSNFEYAPLAEIMGRVFWCPEVFNCNAPDTGNMEVFMKYGTKEQKEKWLKPLLAGEIRSSFVMTEPDVASSDATNIRTTILKQGDEYVINGRKWFITSAMYERTEIFIVMGKSSPENPNRHLQQSQILVPKDTPGVKIERALTTLGYDEAPIGHAEVLFEDVKVPVENILLGEGRGFEIAQGRLGPGRIHHCMRLIGAAQRSLEQACRRVASRRTFGKALSEHQSIREEVAKCFAEIEQARQLTLLTASKMDEVGAKNVRNIYFCPFSQKPLICVKISFWSLLPVFRTLRKIRSEDFS